MRPNLSTAGAVLAGLAWLFVARLFTDLLAPLALTPTWIVPVVIVFTFRLQLREMLIGLALVCLLHDATLAIPFGLSASLALPVAAILHRVKRHLNTSSRRQAAAVAFALTPTIHLAFVLAVSLSGMPLPADARGLATEMTLATVTSALATPWLANLTDGMLSLFGARRDEAEAHR